jgi:hypothetical protein
MAGQRKPITNFHCVPIHYWLQGTGAAAFTNEKPHVVTPPQTSTDVTAPGDDLQVRLERMHISIDDAETITITDGTTAIWGPHTLPAGFGIIYFGENEDKSRTGMAITENKIPCITSSSAITGVIDLFGYVVPAIG